MTRRAVGALGLALVMVLAGCIGTTGAGDGASTETTGEQPAQDLEQTPVESTTFAALTVGLQLASDSRTSLHIQDVSAEGLGGVTLVPRTGELHPGQNRPVAAVALPLGETLPTFELRLELRDGLGPATLSFLVGPWTAQDDTYHTVRLAMPKLGTVAVEATEGPATVQPLSQEANPTYGYIAWPNGGKRVLTDFDHVVHVPQGFPRFYAGDDPTFRAETEGAPVEWFLDGRRAHEGATYELSDVEPGRHVVEARVGEQTLRLDLSANDRITHEGRVLVGAAPLETPVEGVNGNRHALPIAEGSTGASLYLRPAGNTTVDADLDLYLADPQGQWVAKTTTAGTSYEHLRIESSLEPGTYTIWVHGRDGAIMDYVVQAFVSYR